MGATSLEATHFAKVGGFNAQFQSHRVFGSDCEANAADLSEHFSAVEDTLQAEVLGELDYEFC
jgi:hypothetical protein